MKLFLKIVRGLFVVIASLVLVVGGMMLSFRLYPQTTRIVYSGCYIEGFQTVLCQVAEDKDFIYYKIIGTKGNESVLIQSKVPKLKYEEFKL